MFKRKVELDPDQLAEMSVWVKNKFIDEIGSQILQKHSEAFRNVITESTEKAVDKNTAQLRKMLEEQFSEWSQDQPLMRRMADCEIKMSKMENSQIAFQSKVETMIEAMLDKLDEIMDGQRPQPNAALQEIQEQLASLDSRLTRLELRGKSSQR